MDEPESAAVMRYVGLRIRVTREQAGLSQRQLARAVHVNQSTVARWEAGELDIGVGQLTRIAVALGKEARFFLNDPWPVSDVGSPDAPRASD